MNIGIITPCYQGEQFIASTIESVISQKGDFTLEYIIADGGSEDGTIDIVKRYIKIVETNPEYQHISMRFISEPDNGMYDAVAKGAEQLGCTIMGYINADDMLLPNALNTVHRIFTESSAQWITGNNSYLTASGAIAASQPRLGYKPSYVRQGYYGKQLRFIQQESTFWSKQLWNKTVDLNTFRSFKLAGDYYLWHQFAAETNLVNVNTALAAFRVHSSQASQQQRAQYAAEMTQVCDAQASSIQGLWLSCHKMLDTVLPNWAKRKLNRWYPYIDINLKDNALQKYNVPKTESA